MKRLSIDPVSFRQSLLQLLEANPPHEDDLLREFERRGREGYPVYSSVLNILTHLCFSEAEARRHWKQVLSHRSRVRTLLGRDVGLRVAILDYFVNVNQELTNPKIIEIAIYERTERSAVTDGLTGLFNHAYFVQTLRRELQRAKRHELQLSIALFDLDNFKRLNDTRGHLEGDHVLMKAAALIKENLREMDVAARYGGEEFVIVLPDTARTGAFVVADRIRRRIERYFERKKNGVRVTISGGVATYPEDAAVPDDLVRRVDEGLYRAKAAGKNRVFLAGGERRRHERLPTPSHRTTVKPDAGRVAPARVRNVSEGGLLVSLKEPVPVGSPVSLVVRPQGRSAMGLRGEVVRVEKTAGRQGSAYDLGVRLLSDPSEAKALLVLRRMEAPAAEA